MLSMAHKMLLPSVVRNEGLSERVLPNLRARWSSPLEGHENFTLERRTFACCRNVAINSCFTDRSGIDRVQRHNKHPHQLQRAHARRNVAGIDAQCPLARSGSCGLALEQAKNAFFHGTLRPVFGFLTRQVGSNHAIFLPRIQSGPDTV